MTCFSPEVMDPLVPFSEGCILHWPATFLIIQGATDCICGLFGDVMIKSIGSLKKYQYGGFEDQTWNRLWYMTLIQSTDCVAIKMRRY